MKRALLILTFVFSNILGLTAHADELEAGKHYTLIDPPLASTAPAGKIEVIEFFSYGCPHCSDFNPFVSAWSAKLPKDVSFRRVPVSFGRPAWEKLASIHYALESSGEMAKLDAAVFKAIHQERANFNSNEAITTWVAAQGGNAKRVGDALNGFSMQSLIRRGDQEAQSAKINGVPAIVVAGRYYVNNSAVKGHDELLRITDALIAQVRKNGGK